MNNKFELTNETIILPNGTTVFRIKATKNFSCIRKGDLGGFVEKGKNLSAEGNCWIYDIACVFGNARIYDDARIYDNVHVYDNARVSGNAHIYDNARVYGNARIYGKAGICEYVSISDYACIHENACISGNAKIYGNADVSGYASVYGDAHICDNAAIWGNAVIKGKAILKDVHRINDGCCISDLSKNLIESIRLQVGLLPINGEVIAYKQVRKDLSSFYDDSFIYRVGEWAEVTDYDTSSASCASGLHFSNPNYWNTSENVESSTFLIAKIKLEDIITVQEGKIRCKRAFILGTYDVE